ncbi:MAG: phage tail tape measure protein, partial [Flavobacteriaceae bacterium]|nr:phage tail tape measure protein [Flavobacteriaceae bacterium]
EEAIILSNASKEELQPAIEALTMVMNQYNVPASEARRIINALAAGSKEGAGEIPYLTTAFEKAGTVAADAGISIETLVATIETLAPRITHPEIAGRSLKGVLLDLQTGSDDTNPSIVGLATALENLGKKNLSVTELTKMFGTENITTAKILINNVGELRKYEAAVTGTNVAIEQAAVNTDNNNAKLAQARNRINIISIALGEKLSPAMTLVTGYFGKSLAILSYLVDVFIKYSGTIITTAAAIAGYTVATKLAVLWSERSSKATIAQIITQKAHILATNAQLSVTQLWAAAQMLLVGNINGASQAMRVFSAVTKLNPIGFIVGIIIAAVAALSLYSKKLTDVQHAQKAVNEVNIDAQKAMVEEKVKVEQLLKIAKNEKLTKDSRLKAIKDLNAISPEYLGNLTLEKINTEEAKKATDAYILSIQKKAKAEASFQKI